MTSTADFTTISQLHHALSDPTRLQIVERLRGGEQCVCELMDVLDAAQSRLSFHLRVLKEAGLVLDRRDGRWVYYTLNRDALEEAREHVERLLEPARDARGKCC